MLSMCYSLPFFHVLSYLFLEVETTLLLFSHSTGTIFDCFKVIASFVPSAANTMMAVTTVKTLLNKTDAHC